MPRPGHIRAADRPGGPADTRSRASRRRSAPVRGLPQARTTWAPDVVVVDVDLEYALQMPLIQDEEPVQGLPASLCHFGRSPRGLRPRGDRPPRGPTPG